VVLTPGGNFFFFDYFKKCERHKPEVCEHSSVYLSICEGILRKFCLCSQQYHGAHSYTVPSCVNIWLVVCIGALRKEIFFGHLKKCERHKPEVYEHSSVYLSICEGILHKFCLCSQQYHGAHSYTDPIWAKIWPKVGIGTWRKKVFFNKFKKREKPKPEVCEHSSAHLSICEVIFEKYCLCSQQYHGAHLCPIPSRVEIGDDALRQIIFFYNYKRMDHPRPETYEQCRINLAISEEIFREYCTCSPQAYGAHSYLIPSLSESAIGTWRNNSFLAYGKKTDPPMPEVFEQYMVDFVVSEVIFRKYCSCSLQTHGAHSYLGSSRVVTGSIGTSQKTFFFVNPKKAYLCEQVLGVHYGYYFAGDEGLSTNYWLSALQHHGVHSMLFFGGINNYMVPCRETLFFFNTYLHLYFVEHLPYFFHYWWTFRTACANNYGRG